MQHEGGVYEYLKSINYSNHLLLDDVAHVVQKHNSDFEALYKWAVTELGDTECAVEKCKIIIDRHYRDRKLCAEDNEYRKNLYFGFNDSKEVNLQQILDKLHCFLMHSIDFGFVLTQKDEDEIDHIADDDFKGSDVELLDEKLKKLHGFLKWKKVQNINVHERMKYNKFGQNDPNNKYYANVTYLYEEQNKMNEDEEYLFVAKKYASLKEEMLSNEVYRTSNEQWLDLTEKASDFMRCKEMKNMRASKPADMVPNDCELVVDNEPIGIEHIISVLLYCNFNELSYHLRSTFYRVFDDEDNKSLAQRHSEFANWSHMLRNTVICFGESVGNNEFYHSVDTQVMFGDFEFSFNGPLSTSSEYMLSYLYPNSKGLTLKLSDDCKQSGLKYFACDWISDFMQESECLLFGSHINRSISIANITNSLYSHDYSLYIDAINVIQKMVEGRPLTERISEGVKSIINELIAFLKKEKEEKHQIKKNENAIEEIMIDDDHVLELDNELTSIQKESPESQQSKLSSQTYDSADMTAMEMTQMSAGNAFDIEVLEDIAKPVMYSNEFVQIEVTKTPKDEFTSDQSLKVVVVDNSKPKFAKKAAFTYDDEESDSMLIPNEENIIDDALRNLKLENIAKMQNNDIVVNKLSIDSIEVRVSLESNNKLDKIDDFACEDDEKEVIEDSKEDTYHLELLKAHFNKIRDVRINLFLMNVEQNAQIFGYSQIKSKFVSDENSCIKLEAFCDIFSNLERVYVENMNENELEPQQTLYLSKAFVESILSFLRQRSDEIKLKEISLSNVDDKELSKEKLINVYQDSFDAMEWVICLDKAKSNDIVFRRKLFKN